eukprot:COSAG04_NODE_17587_length_465_cov_0.702186_1_plen_70_part_10
MRGQMAKAAESAGEVRERRRAKGLCRRTCARELSPSAHGVQGGPRVLPGPTWLVYAHLCGPKRPGSRQRE